MYFNEQMQWNEVKPHIDLSSYDFSYQFYCMLLPYHTTNRWIILHFSFAYRNTFHLSSIVLHCVKSLQRGHYFGHYIYVMIKRITSIDNVTAYSYNK